MQPIEVSEDVTMVNIGGKDGKIYVNKMMVIEGDLKIGHYLCYGGNMYHGEKL